MKAEFKTLQELAQRAIDLLIDGVGTDTHGCDLHSKLFNSDYYIIGYYQAEQWLIANGGVFSIIGMINEYEQGNFGEVCTDLSSSEHVCNMAVYIWGEEVLSKSDTLQSKWDDQLSEEDVQSIIAEIKEEYNL